MAPDLSVLLNAFTASVPGWIIAVVAAYVALLTVYISIKAGMMVIAVVRGQVIVKGKFYDKDVYQSAMQDLHTQKRRGVLMDKEANDALRNYQGLGSGRSRNNSGGSSNRIPNWRI